MVYPLYSHYVAIEWLPFSPLLSDDVRVNVTPTPSTPNWHLKAKALENACGGREQAPKMVSPPAR